MRERGEKREYESGGEISRATSDISSYIASINMRGDAVGGKVRGAGEREQSHDR